MPPSISLQGRKFCNGPLMSGIADPQVKEGKKAKFTLGVAEAKLGNAISEQLSIPCACNEQTGELLRGVRAHAGHLTKVRFLLCLLSVWLGLARHVCSENRVPRQSGLQLIMILLCSEPGDGGGVEGTAGSGAQLLTRKGQVQRQPPGQHDHPGVVLEMLPNCLQRTDDSLDSRLV